MDFVKKRVRKRRVMVETLVSESDQNILRAWTTTANRRTPNIFHPRVDWHNSSLFTSILLQFDILKPCLSSESLVTGCGFQKKWFQPLQSWQTKLILRTANWNCKAKGVDSMPFMSGIVVSKQLFKTLCSFELAFVFLTPTTVETGTGYRMVSCFNCYISHSKVWDASIIFCKCLLN